MSFGIEGKPRTKKALKDMVATLGADNVYAYDTSAFGNKGTVPLSSLADTSAVIVGPDVETQRTWYANVKTVKGQVRVV